MTRLGLLRSDESGWALVTAISLMAIMLTIGLGTLATSDFNSKETRIQRELESSLNLTEGVLYSQAFTLARQWPSVGRPPYPSVCSSATATTGQCPNRENLSAANSSTPQAAAFKNVDFLANGSWTTRVRDNYGQLAAAFNPAFAEATLVGVQGNCAAPCTRDFNGDKALWVQARSVVRGRARSVVALMKLEQLQEAITRIGIRTGALAITNNGAGSYNLLDASAVVRCNPDQQQNNAATCTNYKADSQTTPPPVQGDVGNLMSAPQIERFREAAIINGTYYVGCPPNNNLAGAVVFSEFCPATGGNDPGPTYNAGLTPCDAPPGMVDSCTNSLAKPGILIIRCGGLRLNGGTYVGLMYFVNGSDDPSNNGCVNSTGQKRGTQPPQQASCPLTTQNISTRVVLDVQAGGGIWGALAADGNACITLGSNGTQVTYNSGAFEAAASFGTVGLVQNTWRELPSNVGS